MRAGADGVELDVRLCASGELVVFHDEDLVRLCGDTRHVAAMPWRDLREVRIEGQAIPRLKDVLKLLPRAIINIELKRHPMSQALALVLACERVVEEHRAVGRVVISSFDPRLLLMLRVLEPTLPRGLLFAKDQGLPLRPGWCETPASSTNGAKHPGSAKQSALKTDANSFGTSFLKAWLLRGLAAAAVHPEHVLVTELTMRRWQRRRLRVHTWTVDEPEEIVRLATLGVHAIICNDPAAVLATLRSR